MTTRSDLETTIRQRLSDDGGASTYWSDEQIDGPSREHGRFLAEGKDGRRGAIDIGQEQGYRCRDHHHEEQIDGQKPAPRPQ